MQTDASRRLVAMRVCCAHQRRPSHRIFDGLGFPRGTRSPVRLLLHAAFSVIIA